MAPRRGVHSPKNHHWLNRIEQADVPDHWVKFTNPKWVYLHKCYEKSAQFLIWYHEEIPTARLVHGVIRTTLCSTV